MKKFFFSMVISFLVLMTVTIPAFATSENIIVNVREWQKREMSKQATEETVFEEGTVDPDDLLEVCPKCGKKHDGCCDEDVEHIHFRHYVDMDFDDSKYYDVKGDAVYFVTPNHKLVLVNLKTKQLKVIADNVICLTRSGMNGRNISYITINGEFFNVPEIGEDEMLDTDFCDEYEE